MGISLLFEVPLTLGLWESELKRTVEFRRPRPSEIHPGAFSENLSPSRRLFMEQDGRVFVPADARLWQSNLKATWLVHRNRTNFRKIECVACSVGSGVPRPSLQHLALCGARACTGT